MRLLLILFTVLLLSPLSLYAECGQPHGESPSPAPQEPSTGPSTIPPEEPQTVKDQILLQQGGGALEEQPLFPDDKQSAKKSKPRKPREEHEVDKDGKRTKTTRYDKDGNKVSETTYQEDGKTPREEKEFYPDGSDKKETFYDDKGRVRQENEYWPPKEGEERGNMKSASTENYDADGNRTGSARNTFDEEGRTIRSDTRDLNGDTITRYDPKTGSAIDRVHTHPNGKVQSDTRFDREGNVISERTYREDGSPESETTNFPDGSSRRQEFNEDRSVTNTHTDSDGNMTRQVVDRRGQVREQTVRQGWQASTTQRFDEQGRLESKTQTTGIKIDVTTYDKKGNPTSETTLEHGMETNKVRYDSDGSSTRTEFYRDGSVRSQTKTSADGSQSSQKYPNGQYFEAEDGSVHYNP